MTDSDHYFSYTPQAAAKERTVEYAVAGHQFQLTSATGVFSATRLDPGTAVLLRKAPLPTTPGDYLDLGCGYGPVAVTIATTSGGHVTAVDVNTRALELMATNAANLGLDSLIRPVLPEQIPDDARFDQIWSNPPIRVGKESLHEVLLQWLPRLKPDGVAWLVVARHKGADSLVQWLGEQGFPAVKHASQKGYRVLKVTKA